MDLTLTIYKDRFCRNVEKVATAQDFELSTAICEDVLNVINIDMWDAGLLALSKESAINLVVPIIKNGFPFFINLVAELFDITEEEAKRTNINEVAKVVFDVVIYAKNQLASTFGFKSKKN